jgi:acyl-CoA thioester hydrolase
MGVAHHAAYIPWLEEGRTELLRTSGISYADLERAGVFLVITRLEMKYRRPVLYDDVVEIRTRWVGGSRVKIEHEYEVVVVERGVVLGIGKPQGDTGNMPVPRAGGDQTPVAVGSTTLACVGRDGRPMPLPEWLMPADVHPRRGG